MLQLLGTVEEEALFRLCDLVVDRDTAGALTFIEDLSEHGNDHGSPRRRSHRAPPAPAPRAAHGRGSGVPAGDRGDARAPARAGEPARRADGDPPASTCSPSPSTTCARAAIRGCRSSSPSSRSRGPGADLARESLAYRLEQLESRAVAAPTPHVVPTPERPEQPTAAGGIAAAERAAGSSSSSSYRTRGRGRSCPPSPSSSIPISTVLGEARPAQLAGDTLTVEFPASASFHRQLAEEPKNVTMLADALYEVTGRRLALAFAVGEGDAEGVVELDEPAGEDRIIELLQDRPRRTRTGPRMSFDMNKLMQQAAQMQEQMQRMQEEAKQETAQSSVGGGLVRVTANGAGEVMAIEISPRRDRPRRSGDARRPRARRRQRGAPLRALGGGGEGAADARRARPSRPRGVARLRARPIHLLELALAAHRARPDRRGRLGLGVGLRPLAGRPPAVEMRR